MLKLDWYIEHPIDFEYKNYILLDYLQSVDKSYQLHQLSPYLLWTEKLTLELKDFNLKKDLFINSINSTYLFNSTKVISLRGNKATNRR